MKKNSNFKEEIIGKEINVITSKNISDAGITGKVIDDTRSTIVVLTHNGVKRVLKSPSLFQIKSGNQKIIVNGTDMMGTSSERN